MRLGNLLSSVLPLLSTACLAYAAVSPTSVGPGDPDITRTDLGPTPTAPTDVNTATLRPTPTTLPEYLDNDSNIGPISWDDANALYLGMKTLVLYKDPSTLMIPKLYLEGLDTPYVNTSTLPDLSGPEYYAIVVADPAWNNGDFRPIKAYAQKYDVRIVYLNSEPGESTNTILMDQSVPVDAITIYNSPDAQAIASIVATDVVWPAPDNLLSLKPATLQTERFVTGVLRFTALDNPNITADGSHFAAILYTPSAGPEEMHFFFNAAAHEVSSNLELNWVQSGSGITALNLALANIWFPWATRGIFLGMRRTFLQVHIDDWFLATTQYKSNNTVRTSGDDAWFAVRYQQNLNARLPAGSSFRFELAYCGAGYAAMQFETKENLGIGLANASDKYVGEFNWVSHTWSHVDMDYLPPQDCDGKAFTCPTTPERMEVELDYNNKTIMGVGIDESTYIQIFKDLSYVSTPAGILMANQTIVQETRFSPTSLVTPEISGIWPKGVPVPANWTQGKPIPGNTPVLRVVYDFGIRTMVGDNSRPELMNKTSFHYGVWTQNSTYGVEGMLIIPRHAAPIPYDANNLTVMMQEYADKKMCPWVPGIACPDDYSIFTVQDAYTRLGKAFVYDLLQWRADPFMLHQANMISFMYQGGLASLASLFVDSIVNELTQYIRTPVLSPRMEDTGQWYRDRMARDACGIAGEVKSINGTWQMVRVKGTGDCEAVVTFTPAETATAPVFQPFINISSGQSVEYYGPDTTFRLPLNATWGNEQYVGPRQQLFNSTNLIQDPSFENASSGTFGTQPPWLGSGSVHNVGRNGWQSLSVTGFQSGMTQVVELNQTQPVPLRVRAWSLPNSVQPPTSSDKYALQVVLRFMDPATDNAVFTAQFDPAAIQWRRAQLILMPVAPVSLVTVSLIFKGYQGIALFDDVSLEQLLVSPPLPPQPLSPSGRALVFPWRRS